MNRLALALVLVPTLAHADPDDARSLTLGVTSQLDRYDATRGMRGELDLATRNGWTVGVAPAVATSTVYVYGQMTATLHTLDVKGVAYLARTARFEHWNLRGALGVGIIHTSASGDAVNGNDHQYLENHGIFPTAEASVRATVPISPSWAVTGGPVVTYYDQWFRTDSGETHRLAELTVFGGLSYRN